MRESPLAIRRKRSDPLRFRDRSRRTTTVLVAVTLALFVGVPLLSAAVILTDDTTTIRAEQTIDEDAYIFGNDVTFNGTATRDIISATEDFDLGETARVGGNVNVAANDIRLAGAIERSARVAAREVVVTGTVGGDLVVAAQSLRIEPGARVTGDLIIAVQDVDILGEIGGQIRGRASALTLSDATVGQDILVGVDDLDVLGTSAVSGAIRQESDSEATIADTATVTGPVERSDPSGPSAGGFSLGGGVAWDVARLLSMLMTGLVVVLVAPVASSAVADGVRRRFPATLIAGVLAIVLVPVIALLLIVTLIGIPVSIVALVLFAIALYLSQVFVGMAIGRSILPRGWRSYGRGYNVLAMVIGVALIGLLRLIPVPFFDLIVGVVVALLGLGALFTAIRDDTRPVSPTGPAHQFGDPGYGYPTQR